MNGRIYDPLLGRFLSVDPVLANPTDLQHYNPYSYVYNRPLTMTDPNGEFGIFGAILGAAIDLGAQVFIEGKSLREVNYLSVGISAIAGATGAGLGSVVANASKALATSALKQVAIRAAGNMVAGAVVGAAQTAATNAVSDESEQKSVLTGALLGAAGGAVGSVVGDAVEAGVQKAGTVVEKVVGEIADTLADPDALATKLVQSGALESTKSISGQFASVSAGAGEVAGSLMGEAIPVAVDTATANTENEPPSPPPIDIKDENNR